MRLRGEQAPCDGQRAVDVAQAALVLRVEGDGKDPFRHEALQVRGQAHAGWAELWKHDTMYGRAARRHACRRGTWEAGYTSTTPLSSGACSYPTQGDARGRVTAAHCSSTFLRLLRAAL